MSDRFKGLLLTLEEDVSSEVAENISMLLRQIIGVVSVEPVPANGIEDCIAKNRVRREFIERFRKALEL